MNFSMAAFRVGIWVNSISMKEASNSFMRSWLTYLGEEAILGSCESWGEDEVSLLVKASAEY